MVGRDQAWPMASMEQPILLLEHLDAHGTQLWREARAWALRAHCILLSMEEKTLIKESSIWICPASTNSTSFDETFKISNTTSTVISQLSGEWIHMTVVTWKQRGWGTNGSAVICGSWKASEMPTKGRELAISHPGNKIKSKEHSLGFQDKLAPLYRYRYRSSVSPSRHFMRYTSQSLMLHVACRSGQCRETVAWANHLVATCNLCSSLSVIQKTVLFIPSDHNDLLKPLVKIIFVVLWTCIGIMWFLISSQRSCQTQTLKIWMASICTCLGCWFLGIGLCVPFCLQLCSMWVTCVELCRSGPIYLNTVYNCQNRPRVCVLWRRLVHHFATV